MKLDEGDKRLINMLSRGLPLTLAPFSDLAKQVNLSEHEMINKIKAYKSAGIIRRFGATLKHTSAGFAENAMSIWIVPKDRVDEVGVLMSSYREVTHCYERQAYPVWRYNLYAMIHGRSRDECERVADEISRRTGIREYKLLYSTEEFKKTSMEYF